MVRGDLPLGCVFWAAIVVVGAVVTAVVRGAWVVLVVIVTRRPSGLVPYCTGKNNLKKKNSSPVNINSSGLIKHTGHYTPLVRSLPVWAGLSTYSC